MSRPLKKRRVCRMPRNDGFLPACMHSEEEIQLTVDEYETIRLIDMEQWTQEECAGQMEISRTTVQGIYDNARRKLADALVNGKRLRITGGDYILCSHCDKQCGACQKRKPCRNHSESMKAAGIIEKTEE